VIVTPDLKLNFEWVLDAKSRKICWIPPDNVQRGNGHFWVGLSLIAVGGGVAGRLSFKELDCQDIDNTWVIHFQAEPRYTCFSLYFSSSPTILSLATSIVAFGR